ncbi:MAG: hypothetical protein ACKOB1_09155 [Planctomycetia bacterium]
MTRFHRSLRRLALACALAAGSVGIASRADDADPPPTDSTKLLPAKVRVAADHTYLRAGPSDDFYPTERIARDAEVEIWAFDASGYAAVRPVAGSFSWVRAADIDDEALLDDGPQDTASAAGRIGVIVEDGAVARIGSQLNDLRHVAQVRLEAGERVRILEEVRIPSGRHAGLWMRIEPPAGEFRWAKLADLALPPALAAFAPRPAAAAATAGSALTALKDAGAAVAAAVEEVRDAASAAPLPQEATPPALEPVPLSQRLFGGWLPMGSGVLEATAQPGPVAVASGGGAVATDELADIDLALSLAVTGPPDQMNLAQIRERLRVAAAKTTSQADRLRAEAIDARLSRFEAIQGKYQALASAQPADASPLRLGSMWSSLSALGSRPVRPGVLPGGGPADGQPTWTPPSTTEMTGRLATVVSRRPDAPRWAIVDEQNTVLVFVTPQTGLNLAPLVGQQVSVRGAQGYMPEYKRPYMVASEARPRLAATPAGDGALTR